MTQPKLVAEVPVLCRIRIPKSAAQELAARYRARAEAERRLVDFLAGIVLVKGLRLEDVTGFDDVAGELLIEPPTEA